MWSLLRLVSLRHVFGSPLRSLLTLIGVAVGVATLVGITSINRSVMYVVPEHHRQGRRQGRPHRRGRAARLPRGAAGVGARGARRAACLGRHFRGRAGEGRSRRDDVRAGGRPARRRLLPHLRGRGHGRGQARRRSRVPQLDRSASITDEVRAGAPAQDRRHHPAGHARGRQALRHPRAAQGDGPDQGVRRLGRGDVLRQPAGGLLEGPHAHPHRRGHRPEGGPGDDEGAAAEGGGLGHRGRVA